MTRRNLPLFAVELLVVVAMLASPAAGSWDNWNCNLRVYWGALEGAPRDTTDYLGVRPGSTDDYDINDARKPPEPMGEYVYAWFERPAWGIGRIAQDWRAPIAEGASKRWGTSALTDTWNVKTNLNADDHSGYYDESCDPFRELEYPVAASVYVTWGFGVSYEGPPPTPPGDYAFALIYRGGISPKPAGTKLPDAMDPPAFNTQWDMKATPHIVLPLWSSAFQPWRGDCGFDAADTAKFLILVSNPPSPVSCTVAVSPEPPQHAPAAFTFTATACCDEPFAFSWDFGDGATGTGNPTSHTYTAAGVYTATCTVTDVDGQSAICNAEVTVTPNSPPTCDITFSPPNPLTGDAISFDSHAADPDGTVTSVTWAFGDGTVGSGITTTHQYATKGNYLVTATVTDDSGATGGCLAVVVVVVPNQPPTCGITYTPAGPTTADTISFDSHASDPDGTVTSVTWAFGDGTVGSGVTTTHQYATTGYYLVAATVTDDGGATGACCTLLAVSKISRPPTCDITYTPASPITASIIRFDSHAVAPDSRMAYVAWDFGDGTTVLDTSTTDTHQYSTAGTYIVTAMPTDWDGGTGTCSCPVTVGSTPSDYGVTFHVDCGSVCPSPTGTAECPFRTIQDAINAAKDGDTVLVSPCTYYENINFLGKAITVRSTDPADPAVVAATVVDGRAAGSVVTFENGECEGSLLTGFTITNGRAGVGAGILCGASSPTITRNIITGNGRTYQDDGAGVFSSHGSPIISHNTIAGNRADSAGGILCRWMSGARIEDNTISENVGGGVSSWGSYTTISGNRILDNTGIGIALTKGDIAWGWGGTDTITHNEISGNRNEGEGGGIWCSSCMRSVISGNVIANNSTASYGGGVFFSYGDCGATSRPTLANNLISHNIALLGGGGVCSADAVPVIANNTLAGNDASDGGGILCLDYHRRPTVVNNVVAFGSSGIMVDGDPPALLHNCVYGNVGYEYLGIPDPTGVDGNIWADPMFVDAPNGDYHLLPSSPCVDTGLNDWAPPDDIDGQPRPWPPWGIVDMGADEVVPPPTCAITWQPPSPTTDDVMIFQSGAADPYDMVISVVWDFGDGATAEDDPAGHQYTMPGSYTVSAATCNGAGLCATCAAEVLVGKGANVPPACEVTYDPPDPETGQQVTFHANASDPNPWGEIVACFWDFGDGHTATDDPATHSYSQAGQYPVCVTVTDDQGDQTTCCTQVVVRPPCECDVAIDRTHCKMPAAGHIGQCKTGQIGARNMSYTERCEVVMRVTDNTGSVVFESDPITIGPGRTLRVRFNHCYTADEIGRNVWTWEVWPVNCGERTPWNNAYLRKVIVHP